MSFAFCFVNNRNIEVVTDRQLAYDFFRDKCLNATLGVTTTSDYYTSFCHKHCEDHRDCDIKSLGECRPLTKPLITLDGPIFVQIARLKCVTHNVEIDPWQQEFVFGETDDWLDESKNVFSNCNGGIVKYGEYLYSWDAFRYIWSSWTTNSKINKIRENVGHLWRSKMINLFSTSEYVDLCDIFGVSGYKEVFDKMIDLILPSIASLIKLVIDLGFHYALPLANKLVDTLLKLGQRWFGWDGTEKIGKGIITCLYLKFKMAILTVKGEFGFYLLWDYLPKRGESLQLIVPTIAKLVYKTLKYGPYRPDQENFAFCCDDAAKFQRAGKLIFDYVIKHFNDGKKKLWNVAKTICYDLIQLKNDCVV